MSITLKTRTIQGVIECDLCKRTIEFEIPIEPIALNLKAHYDRATPSLSKWLVKEDLGNWTYALLCPNCQ